MAGIAVLTATLIIVLSVFNGLEDLLHSLNNSFDPEIKIQAREGKSFEASEELLAKINGVPGVHLVTEVIEDYAYVRYRDANQTIIVKGVSDNFLLENRIPEGNVVEGNLKLHENGVHYAVIGRGVQLTLSIAVSEPFYPLQVYYIKNEKTVGLDPSRLYHRMTIVPGGVFSIVQQFDDNYIIVPLEFAKALLDYGDRRTSLEVKAAAGVSPFDLDKRLERALGDSFEVLNPEEQHKDLYKLLKFEKMFAFLALAILLLIGSINVFFNLMMLAVDKKKDISILSAMGASGARIGKIFLAEGALLAFIGAFVGMILGGVFCWAQMNYGLVSMGMESAVTQGYPVKMKSADFFAVAGVVTVITLIISAYPARMAGRVASLNNL